MLRAMSISIAPTTDPFRVLGVPPTASAADVRSAFRTLVRQFHPDANPAARPGTELNAVVAAYRRLGQMGVLATPAPVETPAALRPRIDVYA